MTTPDEIRGAFFRVYWTADRSVRFDAQSDAMMTKADAQAAVDAVATITDGKPTGLLVDMSRIRGMDRDARTVFGRSPGDRSASLRAKECRAVEVETRCLRSQGSSLNA